MITLEKTKECVKHIPFTPAISTIANNFDEDTQFTFCQECEQNIERFSFYDEDRGSVYSKWKVSK